jgi:hypothetical protein
VIPYSQKVGAIYLTETSVPTTRLHLVIIQKNGISLPSPKPHVRTAKAYCGGDLKLTDVK